MNNSFGRRQNGSMRLASGFGAELKTGNSEASMTCTLLPLGLAKPTIIGHLSSIPLCFCSGSIVLAQGRGRILGRGFHLT